ncbi:MAG: PilZ domain-containing protein [Candidatus Eremiobacteraeota bacterium]|nr:PilZ domain-containing protein [Candidatus Eremiobacteraeota bacterium]
MLSGFFSKKAPQLVDRDGERYDVSLRVLSRELPGYRGVTLDLSRSGVQLETSGLLTVGSEPMLKFEFDRGELESFECPARVVWSRQDDVGGRKFRSGLTFLPSTDDEKRQLARMSTVLQTRSETDLNTLLDQALRIDPELERSYANISTNNYSQYSAPPAEPPKPPAAAQPQQQAPAADEPIPHPGVYMPLNITLEGYTWNRASKTLHLGIREGDHVHSLYFPNCQLFQVMEPATDEMIVGLYSTATSPATRRLELGTEIEYKHYRFVAEGGKGLIDIVSEGCKPRV